MINTSSLKAVAQATFSDRFCRPLYSSYCFSRIPGTILSLFGGKSSMRLPKDTTFDHTYDHLILLFVDGFGWRFFEHYAAKYPVLKRFRDEGIASKLTAQFPSTTAGHVTCINTGLPVGESGVYEWFYYEPKVDRVIAPLLFSCAGDKETDSLKKMGISPEELYPTSTLYQKLTAMGVQSFVIQHESIAHSSYSEVMFRGAQKAPYMRFDSALKTVSELQAAHSSSPSYFYLYFGDIDAAGHRHGIFSKEFDKAVDSLCKALEASFAKKPKTQAKTAYMIIADHGMTAIDPKTTLYLNQELPELQQWIQRDRRGELIAPAGSCRDFFLHIKPEYLSQAKAALKARFQGIAEIFLTKDLLAEKLFGPRVSDLFLQRVGNLVVLPYEYESIWWYEKNRFEQHFYAMHGGLTREEMEIPFLFLEL